ncbi:MAG: class I SAM-dependent methyltransferase [Halanaerobiales bacterium]|nr:class I SAM-dependent methyltransferase [Halanaerobiales bacterium]
MDKNEGKTFVQKAKNVGEEISEKSIKVAKEVIKEYKIGKNKSVLDIGAGIGIFYSILKDKHFKDYVGLDISPKMIDKFSNIHPEADIRRIDFEKSVELDKKFDFVVVFDTIPHLEKIDMVFKNAYQNLKIGGEFLIVHSKTREEIKKHHDDKENKQEDPIPTDEVLRLMTWTYGFDDLEIKDDDYFLFHVKKKK